jgi:hypothetical protein
MGPPDQQQDEVDPRRHVTATQASRPRHHESANRRQDDEADQESRGCQETIAQRIVEKNIALQ